MLDIRFKNKLKPKKGRILISDPFENDAFFQRSIVYLCDHDETGSFGFVLNNTVLIQLNQLNENFPAIPVQLHIGGPVETQTMYFIHRMGDQIRDSLLLEKEMYLGGNYADLYKKINFNHIENNEILFFLGYSGWSKGQLDREINENAWVVAELDSPDEFFALKTEDSWKYFMNKLGEKFKMMSNFPLDPTNN